MEDIQIASYLLHRGIGSIKARNAYELGELKDVVSKQEIDSMDKVLRTGGYGTCLYTSDIYPRGLNAIRDFPSVVFYKGDIRCLNLIRVVVVGTRGVSSYGRRVVRSIFGDSLLSTQIVLVSGLAYGIDKEVHCTAIDNGIKTTAVVAGGIDRGYPKGNRGVYEGIVKNGCVIAEYPPGKPVVKGMFPMRNRILAALADILIVVEAPKRSGALITAQLALEYGKDVYVVPGSIYSNNNVGSHDLVKQGAGIITSTEDLLDILELEYSVEGKVEEFFKKYPYFEVLKDEYMREGCFDLSNRDNSGIVGESKYTSMLTKLDIEGILWRDRCGKYIIK